MCSDSDKEFPRALRPCVLLLVAFFLLAWGAPIAWGGVGNHSLYLDENGSLWAMGDNDNGQLGDGNQTDRNQSVGITLAGIVAVANGGDHSLYLKDDGSLWAAGDNSYGQLGDGTTTDRNNSFVQVLDANVTAVTAGEHHSLFLKSDGSLWVMGRNDYGQLGTGDNAQKTSPTQILPSGVASITAGAYHSLLIKLDGSLWGTGRNDYGQLGNGFTANLSIPQQILFSGVMAAAAGDGHSLFLEKDGSLWATGLNLDGQLGLGDDANRSIPVVVVDANVTAVAAGAGHSYFLKTDGSLWAMGLNADGQLGLGDQANRSSPVEVVSSGAYRLPGDQVVVGQGSFFSLIQDTNGSLRGMGQNDNGELGLTGAVDRNVSEVITSSVKAFSEGGDYSLFVKSDGSLWGMGSNAHGQLGDGTTIDRNLSVQIRSSGVVAVSASGSNRFSLFLETNGSLQGMGLNLNGELGVGDTTQRLTPTNVATSVVSFAAGHDHALFVKGDGSLWAMGSNAYGQLGDGTTTDRNSSLQVDANVSAVAAGDGYSLFLKRDGSLWSMGRNNYGQLGDGSQVHLSTPVQVFADEVEVIAAGDYHSLFLRSDGSLWGMGRNHYGQLGMGDLTGRTSTAKILTTNVTSVSAGHAHTLILKTNALWGTGINLDGQLGLGDFTNRTSFYLVDSSGVGSLSGVATLGGTPPVITSYEGNATVSVSSEENASSLTVAAVTVYDLENSSFSFSIFGGADADLFEVNASEVVEIELEPGKDVNVTTGSVSFKLYPDYEHPHDADLDNVYEIIVRASDGNQTTDQALAISVLDANDTSLGFTHAGVAGRFGPTQAEVDANYTGSSLQQQINVNTQGIQEWTVPYKALYRIDALGAQGGAAGSSSGGRGARTIGVFDLNVSTALRVLVGQQGVDGTVQGAGGGGGTFVTYSDNVPLLVAGGGGGAGSAQAGGDGNASASVHGGNANGGGGLDQNGSLPAGGLAFTGGGAGGDGSGSPDGGFGGGGAAVLGDGGGGGGYNGGNGGSGGSNGGLGGGSYNGDAQGFSVSGHREGNGTVRITLVKSLNAVPRDIFSGTLYVEENASVGTMVGDFNGTDDDVNATLTFSLVDGNGSTHNAFFTLDSNGTLRTANGLDYETNETMSILVRVTDVHNATYEEAFGVNVTDLDDEAPVIYLLPLEGNGSVVTVEVNATYSDPGAIGSDNVDANVTIFGTGTVLANVPGVYVLTYDLNDTVGNAATQLTRTVTVVDTTAPVITLNGDANVTHEAGSPYLDANATWADIVDGNGTVIATGEVNVSKLGTYELTYFIADSSDNNATAVMRWVTVVDTEIPIVTIQGDANVTHEAGIAYEDTNATWTDNLDGNGTASWQGGVNPYLPGVYFITYSYTDSSGNEAELVTRTITVADTIVPVIALEGNASLVHEAGQAYLDSGASWTDVLDGNGTADVNGSVLANVPGTYVTIYSKTDAAGNEAIKVSRTITVQDTIKPIILLEGNATLRHRVFQPYVDAGSKATDSLDGNLSATVTGSVDVNLPGTYTLSYSVQDQAGNDALSVIRQVEVFNDAPTSISPAVLEVEEVLPAGSLVETLSTIDLDDPNATREYLYALVSGTGSTDNSSFSLDPNGTLRTGATFDFESKPSHSILVRSTDEFNASVEQVVTVEVLDAFLPGVSADSAKDITLSSAFLVGEVEDEGHGLGVIECGFVLGLTPDFVLGGQGTTKVSAGSGSGDFNATANQLEASTRYYFRAFSTNAEGTGYSSLEWFDTNGSANVPTWANATESPDAPRWWQSPWFGNFAVTIGTDWIYHEHYGWLYVALDGTNGFWFWQEDLGWLWTRNDLYPHLYGQRDGWYYYLGAGGDRVFFFRYSDGTWVDVARDSDR